MVERTIVLPTRDNSGVSLAREVASVKRGILTLAGGYSEVKQRGAWVDGDRVYRDTSIRLSTTVNQDIDAEIVARIPYWAGHLRQVCIYTHATEVQSDFVYPETASTSVA